MKMTKSLKLLSCIAAVFAFCFISIGYAAVQDELLINGNMSVDGYYLKDDFNFEDTEGYDISNGTLEIKEIYYDKNDSRNYRIIGIAENGFTDSSFADMSEIEAVKLPNSVAQIGENAFVGLPNLKEYIVDADNEEYMSENGILYNKDGTSLIHYPHNRAGDNFAVPERVTTINTDAFDSNAHLLAIIVTEKLGYMNGTTWGAADRTMLLDNRLGVAIKSVSSNYTVTLADNTLNGKALTQTGANGTQHDNVESNGTFTLMSSAYNGGKWDVLQKSSGYAYVVLDSQNVLHLYANMENIPLLNEALPPVDGVTYADGATVKCIYDMPTHIPAANHLSSDKYVGSWSTAQNSATAVIVETPISPSETTSWFKDFKACTSMELSKLDTSHVTDMHTMFQHCTNLVTLNWDTDKFTTAQVTDMGSMFYGCQKLQAVDVSKFDTSNVTAIDRMFYDCLSLTSLDVSSFDTSKAKDFIFMFGNCKKLASLDLSKFNTANITSMNSMFNGCNSLTELDVSNFNTAKVTDMSNMFSNCSSLTSLNLENFKTENVTSMPSMFEACTKLETLTWKSESFKTAKVTSMSRMFFNCQNLKAVNISTFNVENVEAIDRMFYNCGSLTELDFSNFNISKATVYTHLFEGCSKLTELNLSKFNTANVTDMRNMFTGCKGLTSLMLGENFSTANVTEMGSMFSGCSNLTSLDVSRFDTARVKDMNSMFQNCSKLKIIDVSNFDTSKVTTMLQMFRGCSSLEELTWNKKLGSPNLTSMKYMFLGCSSLKALTWTGGVDTSNVTDMLGMFSDCKKLQALNLSGFNTSCVIDMQTMFAGCEELHTLNLSGFDTRNVTSMLQMFTRCYNLTKLNLSSFDTSNVTNMQEMFNACRSLKTIIVSEYFKTDKVTNSYNMFNGCVELKGGNGTAYSSQYKEKEYARIDADGRLGYFTSHNVATWTPDADGIRHYGTCDDCGETVYEMHTFENAACVCGQHEHIVDNWSNYTVYLHRGTCSVDGCGVVVTKLHNFVDGVCTDCNLTCKHGSSAWSSLNDTYHHKICHYCGEITEQGSHEFDTNGKCKHCNYQCTHSVSEWSSVDGTAHIGTCSLCGAVVTKNHAYTDGICVCGKAE